MKCGKCGAKIPLTSSYCPSCGEDANRNIISGSIAAVFERVGKIPFIIAAIVTAASIAAIVLLTILNAPTAKFELDVKTAVYTNNLRDYTFFDGNGNKTGTVEDVNFYSSNRLGTMFLRTNAREIYAVYPTGETVLLDTGIENSRFFGNALCTDVVYYQKQKKLYRRNCGLAKPEVIGEAYGTEQYVRVSRDGSCAVWEDLAKMDGDIYAVGHIFAYRGGVMIELKGAERACSISDDGNIVFGTKETLLVKCSGDSTVFAAAAICDNVEKVSADGTRVLFFDKDYNSHIYDGTTDKDIKIYSKSLSVYEPKGAHYASDDLSCFIGDIDGFLGSSGHLYLFKGNGSGYSVTQLLGMGNVSDYDVSLDGRKAISLTNDIQLEIYGVLAVKDIGSAFGKASRISDNVSNFYCDPDLNDIYFIDKHHALYYYGGSEPELICRDTDYAKMYSDGVLSFIHGGEMYYSAHGGEMTKAEGIGTVDSHISGITDADGNYYITYNGKEYIKTDVQYNLRSE